MGVWGMIGGVDHSKGEGGGIRFDGMGADGW